MRAIVALLLALIAAPAAAQAPADEFAVLSGRTIRFIIGGSAGGTQDAYSRAIVEGLERVLPNTTVLAQNIGGGGGLIAIAEAQAASGNTITIVSIQNNPIYAYMLGSEVMGADLADFSAVGSFTNDQLLVSARASLNTPTFEALAALDDPIITPVASETAQGNVFARILASVTSLRFKILMGVDAPLRDTLLLAGEADVDINSYVNQRQLIEAGSIVPVLKLGRSGYPTSLNALPTLAEIADPSAPPAMIEIVDTLNRLGRLVLAAPGTEPEVVDALRVAFDRAMASPELVAVYERQNLARVPTSGDEVEARLGTLLEAATVELFRHYLDCGRRRIAGEVLDCSRN